MRRLLLAVTIALGLGIATSPAHADDNPAPAAVTDAGVEAAAPVVTATPIPVHPGEVTTTTEAVGAVAELALKLRGRAWLPALGLAVLLLVYAARRWLLARWDWVQTRAGGIVTTFVVAALVELATLLAAGKSFSLGELTAILAVAWSASGAWSQRPKAAT